MLKSNGVGLYRIRDEGQPGLAYIGQGRIKARLDAHRRRALDKDDRQGRVFAARRRLECSYVLLVDDLPLHQLLELENDLIAAHMLVIGDPPTAQFLG